MLRMALAFLLVAILAGAFGFFRTEYYNLKPRQVQYQHRTFLTLCNAWAVFPMHGLLLQAKKSW